MSGEVVSHTEEEIEALEAARDVGPSDLAALGGGLNPRQLARIDEALTLASRDTELLFSVYIGGLGGSNGSRAVAEKLINRLDIPANGAVLLAVSPGERELHIVTSPAAQRRLPNRTCALAALGMRAAFSGGDLTGGIVTGLRMLADAAGSVSR